MKRLWKVINEYARNNKFFATAKEFCQRIKVINDLLSIYITCTSYQYLRQNES
ncbi:MAG: hypothetical protein KAH18_03300 [Psychromonas sp.]|nr:hypothetical protein [Psychromonas sp.]